jgi:hypothetical protein
MLLYYFLFIFLLFQIYLPPPMHFLIFSNTPSSLNLGSFFQSLFQLETGRFPRHLLQLPSIHSVGGGTHKKRG